MAFALASAVAYLRALEAHGMALAAARDAIYFRLSADADQFLTMAKFRAARKLWARVEQACGLTPKPAMVTAETAWRMMTKHDPYVNMLRTTIAVAAAGLGGADAVTVLPYTAPLGLPDPFARRIARNTQLVLLEESNLARVGDPAAGSGALEAMTHELCTAAWAAFREIEQQGGVWAALETGLIQRHAAAVRAERERAVARRTDILTGSNEYPNINEVLPAVLDVAPAALPKDDAPITAAALPRIRLAEPFEQLRDASDKILAQTGARPKVFLATLGKPADFNARANFAKNFFEAGGIEAVEQRRRPLPDRRNLQGVGRRARLPVRGRQDLRQRGQSRSCRAQGRRRAARLSGRTARREGRNLAGGGGAKLHLRGLRCPGDTAAAYDILR